MSERLWPSNVTRQHLRLRNGNTFRLVQFRCFLGAQTLDLTGSGTVARVFDEDLGSNPVMP